MPKKNIQKPFDWFEYDICYADDLPHEYSKEFGDYYTDSNEGIIYGLYYILN